MNSGHVYTEDEALEIEQWKRGMELRSVVSTDAWQVLKDTLSDYVDKADRELRQMLPGDPNVPTAHAALSALDQMVKVFVQDVETAASQPVPDVLRQVYQEDRPDNGQM